MKGHTLTPLREIVFASLLGMLLLVPSQQVAAEDQPIEQGVGVSVAVGDVGLGIGVGTYNNGYGPNPYYSNSYYAEPYYNGYNTGIYVGGGANVQYDGYGEHRGNWNDNRNWRDGEYRGDDRGYSRGGYLRGGAGAGRR